VNSSSSAIFALFLLLQLVTFVAVLLGGIYAIYCLHRMGENLNRLADVAETWMMAQQNQNTPSAYPSSQTHEVIAQPTVGQPTQATNVQPTQYPVSSPTVKVPSATPSSSVDNESNF
jgi:hypothetical protein